MSVRSDDLLGVATKVFIAEPGASLGDVAAAAGMSRTTLHARFPTRQALLVALAMEAMDLIAAAYDQARLDDGRSTKRCAASSRYDPARPAGGVPVA